MDFKVTRSELIAALQRVIGVVEKRQTLPILSNVLIQIVGEILSVTGTDLEVELIGRCHLEESANDTEITLPGRKLMDICRSLPDDALVHFKLSGEKVTVKSGKSRFVLAALSAKDFPNVEEGSGMVEFSIAQSAFHDVMDKTHFAMAQQDVRYYLNGLLMEFDGAQVRAIATDGHRLAMCYEEIAGLSLEKAQIIIPRKGVLELLKLLDNRDDTIYVVVGKNHLRITSETFTFVTKLIEGKFPDYNKVLPKGGNKLLSMDKNVLKQSLTRVSILSNEKFRGVRVLLGENSFRIQANNPEQEEAEEELPVEYSGETLDIGFNVSYLIDVLGTISSDEVKLTFLDANSSVILEGTNQDNATYIVMPMRL